MPRTRAILGSRPRKSTNGSLSGALWTLGNLYLHWRRGGRRGSIGTLQYHAVAISVAGRHPGVGPAVPLDDGDLARRDQAVSKYPRPDPALLVPGVPAQLHAIAADRRREPVDDARQRERLRAGGVE